MDNVPSNTIMWAGIVGFVMPVAVAVVMQSGWSDRVRSLVGFACCLIAGAGTAWFAGNFDGRDIVSCVLVTFTIAIATYYGFWRPTGIAPRIESATSRHE